jgi:hypothetical protein
VAAGRSITSNRTHDIIHPQAGAKFCSWANFRRSEKPPCTYASHRYQLAAVSHAKPRRSHPAELLPPRKKKCFMVLHSPRCFGWRTHIVRDDRRAIKQQPTSGESREQRRIGVLAEQEPRQEDIERARTPE